MTHVTCRLTEKNRDQLRKPTLGNRVWATFTFCRAYNILTSTAIFWHMGRYTLPVLRGSRPDNTALPIFFGLSARKLGLLSSTFKIVVGPSRRLAKLTVWPAHFSYASAAYDAVRTRLA